MSFALKKIMLILIYLCFNAGLSYSMHFCEGVLQHFNFFAESETCCPEQGTMPDCCEDLSHLDIPNGEEFQPAILIFPDADSDQLLTPFNFKYELTITIVASYKLGYAANAPPSQKSPLFLLNQVFLV